MPVVDGRLEVEFVPGSGTYIDLSSLIVTVEITRPRPTPSDPAQATTLVAVLRNAPDEDTGISPLTPDSPVALYWPNIDRDRRVRFTAVWNAGASTSERFDGWSDSWAAEMGDGPEDATVTLTASCVLSRYARRRLLSDYGERITLVTTGPNDYWPYDEGVRSPDAVSLRGVGSDIDIPAATVVPPHRPDGATGSLEVGTTDAGILVDGIARLTRGDGTTSPSPVILHRLRDGEQVGRVSQWVQLDTDPYLGDDTVWSGYGADGELLWRLVVALVSGNIEWRVLDGAGGIRSQWNSGHPRDQAWTWVSVLFYFDSPDVLAAIAIRDKVIPDRVVAGGTPGFTGDPRDTRWITVGGRMSPTRRGKQDQTLMGTVSSFWVQYAELAASASYWSTPGIVFPAVDRTTMFINYGSAIDSVVGGGLGGSLPDESSLMLTGQARTSLLDAWAEHARTVGGHLFTTPTGRRQWRTAAEARSSTVTLTLDVEADLHVPAGGWQGQRDELPTRVTAQSPAGSVTHVDTASEALTGLETEGSPLDTSAGTIDVARAAAAWAMATRGGRLASFGLDLTLTATDRVADVMALLPGDRVRITGLPSGTLGYTYRDVYASGWVETYDADADTVEFVWDSDPADDPPEARWDDAEYGRFAIGDGAATITGGTCVGTTGTGTVIVTSTSPLTTAAGSYPLDLDWLGERITVTAPGGATSPQTFTVTARGVAPTVARVHAAGEAVELWRAAGWAR